MIRHLRPALVLLVGFVLLTGLAYPMVVTGVARLVFPREAAGSLIARDGRIVGSELIGQNFTEDTYVHGRPSATTDTDPDDPTKTVPSPYNAANSSGSNLAPTNKALIDRVKADVERLRSESSAPIPVDLVSASASGLDPHISPQAAELQVARVARTRGVTEDEVRGVVKAETEAPFLGIIGEPRVNVLRVNIALDGLSGR